MNINPTLRRGYTLIELLVGMTIISIVFTVGIAGFRSFSRRQALTAVSKNLQGDLRSAQQFALTGQKPTGLCPTLDGYTFTIVSASVYRISANCSPDILVKTVNVSSNGVSISGNLSGVKFKVLGQGTDLSEPFIISLSHTIAGASGQITVGTGGDIE